MPNPSPIDRQKVVRRHIVRVNAFNPRSPLTVGNGNFAFGVDATGLQSFPEPYTTAMPLCTMADWGWHSKPILDGLDPAQIKYKDYDTYGRPVPYLTSSEGQKPLFDYLRENPHKFHMGQIGLEITLASGQPCKMEDVKDIDQTLDPWTGVIVSKFTVDGQPVEVTTCCAGEIDAVGVRVKSPLIQSKRLKVTIKFPYGSPAMHAAEWGKDDLHSTTASREGASVRLQRQMDDIAYELLLTNNSDMGFQPMSDAKNAFEITGDESIEFTASFALKNAKSVSFTDAFKASEDFWKSFWLSGGAIDFEGSTDPRAAELERRVVLSQYLLRINSSSPLPPAETGLTCNSWYGKFHLEMHWWHGVHHALWSRLPLLEKSLGYYHDIIDEGRKIAVRQGYTGVRWPKMVDAKGIDSPSPVAPLLIWQQPHPIYYAELVYREKPTAETLEKYKEIVFESAEFMASFAHHDATTDRYVLGPPLKTVSENTEQRTSRNATFELTYWRFGLRMALEWQKRLGIPENPTWKKVLEKLACASTQEGKYLMQEDMTDTYTKWNWEHPALIGALGTLPGDEIDPAIMKNTLEQVMSNWQWDRCWGWDFPMTAMCAARVDRPDLAIDAFFVQSVKNEYLPCGHNYQRQSLPLYLPGNGAFLSAIAMMAAGWESSPKPTKDCPGFPEGFKVKYEGLKPIF